MAGTAKWLSTIFVFSSSADVSVTPLDRVFWEAIDYFAITVFSSKECFGDYNDVFSVGFEYKIADEF